MTIHRFGSAASTGITSGATAGEDAQQVKTTLTAISNQSIATPLGFWNLDQSLVDEVTGGAGNDLTTGFDGVVSWELIQDVPGGSSELYTAWCDGQSAIEADGGGNPGSKWNLDQSLTVSAWAKFDTYAAEGGDNDNYVVVAFVNRSSATIATTTAPPYQLYFRGRTTDGIGVAPQCAYWEDDGSSTVQIGWDDGAGRPIKTPLGRWVHIAMTRLRNGLDDNDLRLYVNGEEVASSLTQGDANLPDSVNMRLQVGQGRNGTEGFPGSIRDVGIWDSALSATDIRALYQIGIGEVS